MDHKIIIVQIPLFSAGIWHRGEKAGDQQSYPGVFFFSISQNLALVLLFSTLLPMILLSSILAFFC